MPPNEFLQTVNEKAVVMHDLFNENLARVTRRQLFGSARQGIGSGCFGITF